MPFSLRPINMSHRPVGNPTRIHHLKIKAQLYQKRKAKARIKQRQISVKTITDVEEGWQIMLISNTVASLCWLQITKAKHCLAKSKF
jgi:hypothetical protein